jgi:hypothetical protein
MMQQFDLEQQLVKIFLKRGKVKTEILVLALLNKQEQFGREKTQHTFSL